MRDRELENHVALVTGAARGMGRAIALRLAEAGAGVVVNDLTSEALKDVTRELRDRTDRVHAVAADVTDPAAVAAMVEDAMSQLSTVDILVNNAGILRPTPVTEIADQEWDLVIDVNLKGTFLCSRAVISYMQLHNWGRIINLSSTAGKSTSTVGGAHYTAAKAGVLGLTRHLAKEVAADGITVNAVCPGLIDTDMVRHAITASKTDAYARNFPIPRLGRPEEVAELVSFLASDKAAYITGASLDINGGDLTV